MSSKSDRYWVYGLPENVDRLEQYDPPLTYPREAHRSGKMLTCAECQTFVQPVVGDCASIGSCPRYHEEVGDVSYRKVCNPIDENKLLNVVMLEDEVKDEPETSGAVKYDAGKAAPIRGVVKYFPRAVLALAKLSQAGAEKYEWEGWRNVPDGFNRYTEAMGRHLIEESFGKYDDGEGGTGQLHITQVAWNALARLELFLEEEDKEDA
jgi:hypothetical protein